MAVGYSVISVIQQAMSFFLGNLKSPEWLYVHHLAVRPNVYIASAYLQVSTTEFGMW